jgi:hypothetical protein
MQDIAWLMLPREKYTHPQLFPCYVLLLTDSTNHHGSSGKNRTYHLQRRYLCPSTFLRDLPEDAYQKSTLCAFLNTNCTKYHLSECGGHNHHSPCFVGSLKIVGFIGKSRSMTIGYAPSSTLLTIYILSHVPPHPQFTSSSLGTITLNRHLTSLF